MHEGYGHDARAFDLTERGRAGYGRLEGHVLKYIASGAAAGLTAAVTLP